MKPTPSPADVEKLYHLHAGELHGYLHRRAGEAGADLLGDVFVVALQRLGDLPEPDLRRAWLFGIARRLLLASERKNRHVRQAENEQVRFYEALAGTSGIDPERVQAVRDALDSLRERDRELIRLTEWEQLTTSEAAAILGLRPGTARVRLHRARRALASHPALQSLFEPSAAPQTDSGIAIDPDDTGPGVAVGRCEQHGTR